VRYVLDEVAVGQFLRIIRFPLSVSFYRPSIPIYSSTILTVYNVSNMQITHLNKKQALDKNKTLAPAVNRISIFLCLSRKVTTIKLFFLQPGKEPALFQFCGGAPQSSSKNISLLRKHGVGTTALHHY
jgi:hypothetical protein